MLSIKQIREQKSVNENEIDENAPKEPYTFDQVKRYWRQYANLIKDEGLQTIYNAMIKREPLQKENHLLVIEVENQIQVDHINKRLQDLTQYLRKNIKNYLIHIEIAIIDEKDNEVKFLNGKDRFAAMASKNPNLHSLRDIFNLDIEY